MVPVVKILFVEGRGTVNKMAADDVGPFSISVLERA